MAITFTRSTPSPLRGTASGLLSKDATNNQGRGVSYAFSIDTADQGKMQEISFDYTVGSSYVDGDMRVFIYDVTNSVLIEPSQRDILANSGQAKYLGYFQASSNSTSYRLIFHVATTSALAYDFKLDNVKVGPISQGNAGTFASDWQSFTPTGSWSTNTTYQGKYRRVGDSLELDVYIQLAGAPTSASLTINMPTGLTIDIAKLAAGNNNLQIVGMATCRDASTDSYEAVVAIGGTTTLSIFKDDGDGTYSVVNQAAPFTFGSTDYISIRASGIPIVGWSTGVSASEISNISTVAFRVRKNASQTGIGTSPTKVTFETTAFDKSGSYDSANNRFIAPESGLYIFQAGIRFANHSAGQIECGFYVNGSTSGAGPSAFYDATTSGRLEFQTPVYSLNKGDYVEVYVNSVADASWDVSNNDSTYFSGFKIATPAQIAPTEFVGCSYTTNAGLSIANNTTTNVVFEDKIIDSHNGMNTSTGLYTIPISGKYIINARVLFDPSTGWANVERVASCLYKNTSTELARTSYYLPATSAGSIFVASIPLSYLGDFVKGDTIEYEILQNSGASLALNADGAMNQISIYKVG